MRTLVLCNSDWLALPAIKQLIQQNMLAGVAVPAKSAGVLVPALRQMGIAEQLIFKMQKQGFEKDLRSALEYTKPELGIVLTFPWKIPSSLFKLPAKGFINFHFGVLPKYKGTDPVFWQLKNGETNGGISAHIINEHIDEGPLLFVQPIPIIPGETYGLHCLRLGTIVPQLLGKAFAAIAHFNGKVSVINDGKFYKAPTLNDLSIDWQTQSAAVIEQLVNAANPRYGGAVTTIRQARIQILEVAIADLASAPTAIPGTIVYADALYGIVVACINNQHLQVKIVCFSEGYYSGTKMFNMGFKPGELFH